MCIKFIFWNSPNEGGFVKPINSHFSFLNFCSRKQKYLQKRVASKYSMYSILLKSLNGHPMCMKVIFLSSPNIRGYIKSIKLHFQFLKFGSRKQKHPEK